MAAYLIQFIHMMNPILKLRSHALLSLVSVRLSSRLAPIVEAAPHLPLANNVLEEEASPNFGARSGYIQARIWGENPKITKSFRSLAGELTQQSGGPRMLTGVCAILFVGDCQ